MEFDHYTPNDGLSFGFTNCVYQDSKGFVWVGTGRGLNRFDGINFKIYLYDSKDPKSLSGNLVMSIIEDTLQNMWIATNNRLDLYDHKKDNFSLKTFTEKDTIYDEIALTRCYIDSKGYMWVGSYGGIYRFKLYDNPQIYTDTIEVTCYVLPEDDVSDAYKTTVHSFVEDEQQRVWVASFSKNLFYFDESRNAFVPYEIQLPDVNSLSNNQKAMIKDSDGDFIITAEVGGLIMWKRKENKFISYKPNGTNTGPNDNLLYAITQAGNGLIWIGSRNAGGINIFNKKTGSFTYYIADPANPYSLSTNSIECFYEDRAGIMWIGLGAGKGLEKYCPGKKKFTRYYARPNNPDGLSNDNILCFAESKSGDIWIGTDGFGLNKLQRETGKFIHYVNEPDNINSLSSNSIISLCEDRKGTLWIATFNGGLTSLKGNKFTRYLPEPGNPFSITYHHIWYVFEDSKENLWVATLNKGIDLFDRKSNRFYHYTRQINDSSTLINNASFHIFEDSKQNIYITSYAGVSYFNLNDYDFSKMPPDLKFRRFYHSPTRNSISSNIVYCVAEDLDGYIWFGTQATGIDRYDPKTGKFTNYSTREGLPGNSVSSILVDDKNILWLATDKGLARFNPKTKEIYVFDDQDGLRNKNLRGWAIKTKDGEMFFGGADGFNSFYPDRIQYNKSKPPVVITGLKLFNQSVKIGDIINRRVLLKNDISETKRLVFKHNEDFITFEFVGLDYTVSERNKYKYKLEGFDKDWVECGTKREASYTSLNPGKYTFYVIASNNDGVWNETGTSIQIIILPPWWDTILFKILAILAVIGTFTGFFLLRVNVLKKQKIHLENVVVERTGEVEQKNKILLKQTAELYEVNTLLEERNQYIEEQNNVLVDKTEKLNQSNNLLRQQKARIEEQSEELRSQAESLQKTNELLQEGQARIEEQSEELRTQTDHLLETNKLLQERQEQIEEQSAELTVTNEQLKTLNGTKDKFFSIIAHDLKNPFNNIIGFSELLANNYKGITDDKKLNFINLILDSSKNIYKLLENLLQWARSQTGTLTFAPEEFLLRELVESNRVLVENMLRDKNIRLYIKTDDGISVFADKNMIDTVFRNLITNAIKFTENGEINVVINREKSSVKISVQDTGVGMSQDKRKTIFDVGSSKSTKGTRGESGTGLGLIICKEFVEKNGGIISVESEENKGTNFWFTLPAGQN